GFIFAMFVTTQPLYAAEPSGPARDTATIIMPEEPDRRKLWEQWGLADAVVHGDTVWLSGVVASLRPGETDSKMAYERAFKAIGMILGRAGASWDDVVEMTTYHTDIPAQMNDFVAVKSRHVRAPFPAWTAIDIDRLVPDGGLVEIRVVAKKR
ncbi:MAG TPA: Rid family hydrolase, partial [Sphingorhabdus sp.]|nr:Rid family hydrolase [Sphingorhabdus sp.]